MLMFASADPASTCRYQPYLDALPAKFPPKLHICLWVGGLPQPPFHPGYPGDVFKVMWGRIGTGFWECQLQIRVTRAHRNLAVTCVLVRFYKSDS